MINTALMLSLVATFAAVSLAVHAVITAGGRSAPVRARQERRIDPSRLTSIAVRALFPLLELLAPLFRTAFSDHYRASTSLALQRAGIGDVMSVNHMMAMRAVSAALLLAIGVAYAGSSPSVLLVAAGGWLLPDYIVRGLRKQREAAIVRTLPGSVDVLSLSVEAGLEFAGAIERLVSRGDTGPLRDELATVLNDIRLGQSRADALKSFARRVDIPEVSSFVSTLVQADMLGASIGPALKSQAERMRVERFQRAERAGAHATQKILFPLIIFIFPAVLIVILGPALLHFIYGF